jgi:hypothetical protein
MTDTRSRTELLREGIVEAMREATALLVAGDRGAKAHAPLARARTLAAELKALSRRMGFAEGYDDAVRILALIEELQAKIKPATGSTQ